MKNVKMEVFAAAPKAEVKKPAEGEEEEPPAEDGGEA